MFSTSKVRASIGRVRLVFAALPLGGVKEGDMPPPVWDGPQPGDVVGGPFIEGERQLVNVNVKIDAANFPDVLKVFRDRGQGNTLTSIPVFDALSNEQRQQVRESGVTIWAEWPPVPARIEPQTVPLDISQRVQRAYTAIRVLAQHISNDGAAIQQEINTILDGVSTPS